MFFLFSISDFWWYKIEILIWWGFKKHQFEDRIKIWFCLLYHTKLRPLTIGICKWHWHARCNFMWRHHCCISEECRSTQLSLHSISITGQATYLRMKSNVWMLKRDFRRWIVAPGIDQKGTVQFHVKILHWNYSQSNSPEIKHVLFLGLSALTIFSSQKI